MSREPEAHKAERETMGRGVSAVMSGESAALGQGTANPKAMNRETARALCQLNTEFYERNAASFSQTRTAPWEGWRRCMTACGFDGLDEAVLDQPMDAQIAGSVLDIACGNLRFEAFLANAYPHIDWSFFAVDNCEPLVVSGQENIAKNVHFTCEDIVINLLDGLPAAEPANVPALAAAAPFDLAVSFGFLHHIPSFDLRRQFLLEALNQVKPGGHLVVSFWQFLNDSAKRAKIEQTHAEALAFFAGCAETRTTDRHVLDRGAGGSSSGNPNQGSRKLAAFDPSFLESSDYFLGWKNQPGNYRYCHHFSNEEIDWIIAALAPHATVVESFSADGKPGNLNRYVVFRREELPIDSIPATNALSSMTDEEIRQHKVKMLVEELC